MKWRKRKVIRAEKLAKKKEWHEFRPWWPMPLGDNWYWFSPVLRRYELKPVIVDMGMTEERWCATYKEIGTCSQKK